jgi:hypothetical protein
MKTVPATDSVYQYEDSKKESNCAEEDKDVDKYIGVEIRPTSIRTKARYLSEMTNIGEWSSSSSSSCCCCYCML